MKLKSYLILNDCVRAGKKGKTKMKTTNTCHQCKLVNICRKYRAWQQIIRSYDSDIPDYIKKLPELMAADCEYYEQIVDSME